MRVLHLGDISGTSRNVIDVARRKGLDWELRAVPAGRGAHPLAVAARRALDLAAVRLARPRPDILHINYGVSGYYGWGRRGTVLHLHGTDVRQDLHSRFLGPVVRRSILTASAVLYSTPDMGDAVRALRPDAAWFPAPLPLAAIEPVPAGEHAGQRLFFASRWDESKGAPELIKLAARLRATHPEVVLEGLDWGHLAGAAREAGVLLLPHMPESDYRRKLAEADVVVGQQRFGVLGLSELEAMAQGTPLVAAFSAQDAYGDEAPLHNSRTADPLELVGRILADPAKAAATAALGREWALAHHSPVVLEERLEELYAAVLQQ
ncbi:glycosyltransferase [Paenarthrobacter sp. DKR-5]|uniref:glycosyltransferase n=1 Tax=Paenarthrobacter sp. DKR-5 TaxID=2835535 RepID=UPI001BDD3C57|nr:glycosyltransferase [Paenarthrobacter sp. DKR-5]MBT1003039.1 glycosyltransferase [Paenarthrobacter sp. DKR-5]